MIDLLYWEGFDEYVTFPISILQYLHLKRNHFETKGTVIFGINLHVLT